MDQFDENHTAYTSDPRYPAIEKKAKAKGFRKASLAEVSARKGVQRAAVQLRPA